MTNVGLKAAKSLCILTGVPYAVAILVNLALGWPQSDSNESRLKALYPSRVLKLNYVVLQQIALLKFSPLYLKWNSYYKNATTCHKNIPFGSNGVRMDVWVPRDASQLPEPKSRPLIFFIYGGAWGSGSKDMYCLLAQELADRLEAVVVVPDYRIYPKGTIRDMVEDVITGVQESRTLSLMSKYSVNAENILLIGHSAGAHLCSMAAIELSKRSKPVGLAGEDATNEMHEQRGACSPVNPREGENDPEAVYLLPTSTKDISQPVVRSETTKDSKCTMYSPIDEPHEYSCSDSSSMQKAHTPANSNPLEAESLLSSIKGVIGIGGVYDIKDHYQHETKRGVEDISPMWRAAQGLERFNEFSPSVLVPKLSAEEKERLPYHQLIHGLCDITVPSTSSVKFAQVLAENDVPVDLKFVPEGGHAELALDMMDPRRRWYDTMMGIVMNVSQTRLQN